MQNDKQILEKMLLYEQKVADYTKGMDYDSFEKNDMAVDACVFNLSQLGETSNQISYQKNLKKEHLIFPGDEDTVMADELLNQTMKCVDMVQSVLDGSGENEYMDRVTKLRHVIDRYYGEKGHNSSAAADIAFVPIAGIF